MANLLIFSAGKLNMQATIVFLTGLGSDSRLFKHQTAAFPGSIALDWIDTAKSGESLEEYALRLADTLPELPKPIIVCGLSLGGMITPYVAQRLGASYCILLCTIRERRQFPIRYYPAWLLIRFCPPLLWAVIFTAQFVARYLLLPCRIRPEIIEQLAAAKTSQFVHLIRMMLDWAYRTGSDEPEAEKIPVIHIHGTRDKVLPIRCTVPDIRIDKGGHLLPLSHPAEINAVIRQTISNVTENL